MCQCFCIGLHRKPNARGGFKFIQAYAAGCNIVILDSDFDRLQIIPGATDGNVQISCIDCSVDSGKVIFTFILHSPIFQEFMTLES